MRNGKRPKRKNTRSITEQEMITVKRAYDPPSPDDGMRILVDRLWPRGVNKEKSKIDVWLKEIAPSNELRKWFSHDPARWEDFKNRYKEELKKKADLFETIRKEIKKGRVTLLFAAKDIEHNNAVVLKEALFQK